MPELQILNSEQHRSLRFRRHVAPWPHFVPIVISEFVAAATCCPIMLAKNPADGRFYAGALFGFRPGENLLVGDDDARPAFQPLDIERQAFFTSGENIAVDVQHERISETDGDPLFDESGQPTDTLRRIQQALGLLVSGDDATRRFIQAMVDLRLAELIDISLRFDDGETIRLDGLYTISLDAVAELEDREALTLFRSGYLQLAYCIANSLRQVSVLANRRNDRLARADAA